MFVGLQTYEFYRYIPLINSTVNQVIFVSLALFTMVIVIYYSYILMQTLSIVGSP